MGIEKKIRTKFSIVKPMDVIILMVVFVMFIALIIGVAIRTRSYKENQILLIQDSMRMLAQTQKVQFERYIDEKVNLLKGLATFPDIYEMEDDRQKLFIKERSEILGFEQLFVMRDNGVAYYIEEDLYRNQKYEPFYNHVMENDVYVTEPFYGGDETITTICVSIINSNGKKVGALCGTLELDRIQEMFKENKMFLNGTSFLVNRNGYYMAAEDMEKVHNKVTIYTEKESDILLVKRAFDEKSDQEGIIIQNGIEYLVNVTYLEDFNWAIVLCVEKKEVVSGLKYIDIWCVASIVVVVLIILCVLRIVMYWHKSDKKMNTDTLTGVRSRAYMEQLLEQMDTVSKADVSVIYLDLNNFKYVNDTYGHDAGDSILRIFADTLIEIFGKEGYVGRIGGDEFMVVLRNIGDNQINELCAQVKNILKDRSKELSFEYTISTSYGFYTRKKGELESLDYIVKKADENMYLYKEKYKLGK